MQNQTGSQLKSHQSWWISTIGRKQLIGVTGLGLSGFVLIHMLGNLLIMVGPQAYNEYSHKLVSNPLIYIAEAGLVVLFLTHLALALRLTIKNYRARDARYAVSAGGAKRTSSTQKSLWAQGLLILLFLIFHLIHFKYGPSYSANYGTGDIRDLHRLVIETFSDPIYSVAYVVMMVILGLHLSHGFGSTFQTLGFHHPRYQGAIRVLSLLYALIVTVGFASQPLYVLFTH